jgi:CrcB protein
MIQLLLVGAGGFVGSVLRFAVSGLAQRIMPAAMFPLGTLVVNVAGCFIIGYGNGLADARALFSPSARLFLFIGLLGGFTTFSTFGYETLALMRDSQEMRALVSVGLHLILGLGAVWLGYVLARSQGV